MSMAALNPKRLIQKLLQTRLAWRLSGLMYWSACLATKGKIMDKKSLLSHCENEIKFLFPHLQTTDKVLEFGCGMGGNVIAVSPHTAEVTGVDINPFFVKRARSLAKSAGRENCRFISYEGGRLPFWDGEFDVVYTWAVFERIPKPMVAEYLRDFSRILKPGGRVSVYMLRKNAAETDFVDLLGDDIYVYFEKDEAEQFMKDAGFVVDEFVDWPMAHVCVAHKA